MGASICLSIWRFNIRTGTFINYIFNVPLSLSLSLSQLLTLKNIRTKFSLVGWCVVLDWRIFYFVFFLPSREHCHDISYHHLSLGRYDFSLFFLFTFFLFLGDDAKIYFINISIKFKIFLILLPNLIFCFYQRFFFMLILIKCTY